MFPNRLCETVTWKIVVNDILVKNENIKYRVSIVTISRKKTIEIIVNGNVLLQRFLLRIFIPEDSHSNAKCSKNGPKEEVLIK